MDTDLMFRTFEEGLFKERRVRNYSNTKRHQFEDDMLRVQRELGAALRRNK